VRSAEFVLALLIAVAALVTIARRLGIAYPIFLVIGGLLLGVVPGVPRPHVAPDLIFGAMSDKDVEAMAAALGPAVTRIRLVPAASPRGASPEDLARRFADARPDAAPAESLEAALEEFLVRPTAETIIIAGSLYLVGEARAALLSGRFD